ncbi:TPA: Eco47II family restriction endonuclease [Listeria monocytogenes]|nr:Eco47II family restriction endonuclease [Listeria monocytogenes]EAE7943822.1 Eco47II family restriction endonuclease [Listeria monocytogenes]EAG9426752.1 Eco47II family restriction endonuclease [Listeria monocytogenes]EHP2906312.1 Eco47II family restriction endonuclease [Listeria monocytogenes]EHP2950908.1 Eco47II family restriction endonuclease [Listeria monocytogenes]
MWNLTFISEEQLTFHVKETIKKYGEKLKPFDLKKFNNNIIDPIKLIFDKNVYQMSWEEIIKNEILRQRDKSSNNDIGYFHQNIFQYIEGCVVPSKGWDVIYTNKIGIDIPDGNKVNKIYVEMKNKHNTMNSSSAAKTYIKMQNQVLQDDECACYLVEAIAKKSQNIKWVATVDKQKVQHKLIRRVSMDQFYSLVTGEQDAFYQLCMTLPSIIAKVLSNSTDVAAPKDIVFKELLEMSAEKDISFVLAIYMLGFEDYSGFKQP